MKEDFGKHLTIILKKMCRIVGAKFDEIDFKDAHWYYKYSWTEKQEKDFIDWMADYLYKNKEARWELCEFPQSHRNKKYYRDGAGQFVWCYGWRVKDEIISK
jgi:hypothetical protein